MNKTSALYGAGFALFAGPALALTPPMTCTIAEMCAAADCQSIGFVFTLFPEGDGLGFGNQNGDSAMVQVHPDGPDGVQVLTLVEPGVDAFLLVIQADGAFELSGLELTPSPRGPLIGRGQCAEDG